MPLYEFRCPDCGEEFEKLLRHDFTVNPECSKCGCGKTEKKLSTGTSFSITGEGVYKPGTHY